MAYTSTETKVSVLAGNNSHTGILEVGFTRVGMSGSRMSPDEPPYDYAADAVAIIGFLKRFLPKETLREFVLEFRLRAGLPE
jgi:hypothetical protein